MKLRPHHLLCIQKFSGHGYDEGFTENMKSVITSLVKEPETEITLCSGADVLCEKCPKRCGGECQTEESVKLLDSGVLNSCGFREGRVLTWNEARTAAGKIILDSDAFLKICADCSWYGLCSATEDFYEKSN